MFLCTTYSWPSSRNIPEKHFKYHSFYIKHHMSMGKYLSTMSNMDGFENIHFEAYITVFRQLFPLWQEDVDKIEAAVQDMLRELQKQEDTVAALQAATINAQRDISSKKIELTEYKKRTGEMAWKSLNGQNQDQVRQMMAQYYHAQQTQRQVSVNLKSREVDQQNGESTECDTEPEEEEDCAAEAKRKLGQRSTPLRMNDILAANMLDANKNTSNTDSISNAAVKTIHRLIFHQSFTMKTEKVAHLLSVQGVQVSASCSQSTLYGDIFFKLRKLSTMYQVHDFVVTFIASCSQVNKMEIRNASTDVCGKFMFAWNDNKQNVEIFKFKSRILPKINGNNKYSTAIPPTTTKRMAVILVLALQNSKNPVFDKIRTTNEDFPTILALPENLPQLHKSVEGGRNAKFGCLDKADESQSYTAASSWSWGPFQQTSSGVSAVHEFPETRCAKKSCTSANFFGGLESQHQVARGGPEGKSPFDLSAGMSFARGGPEGKSPFDLSAGMSFAPPSSTWEYNSVPRWLPPNPAPAAKPPPPPNESAVAVQNKGKITGFINNLFWG